MDKTGLGEKRFDFTLPWSFGAGTGNAGAGPSWFTAVEEHLGFKMVASKEPVKVLVIDRMEKPSSD